MPPPHYSFDQARYDNDKAKDHCCGCSNHKCHGGQNTGVKIEEQNLETEPKPKESDFSSMIKLPNYPYPVAWVPLNHLKEKDTNKNPESQSGPWNGWIPLDVDILKGLRQGGVDKKGLQNEEKKSPFPRPIIWRPGNNKPEEAVEDQKEINTSPNSEEKPKVKIIPLKFLENENREEKPVAAEHEPKAGAQLESRSEKEIKTKTIPVKQMKETSENEKQHEKSDKKKSNISEKQKEENGVKKCSDGKKSKLPPVCLRVDPLPRKKNGNGKSRSPSPPSFKEKDRSCEDNKEQCSTWKEIMEEIPKKEIRVVDVKDVSSSKVDKQEQSSQDVVPFILMNDAPQKSNEVCEQRAKDGHGGAEASDGKGVECKDSENGIYDNQEKKTEKNRGAESAKITRMEARKERTLSESDAAVLIQSVYRGFEVRRWQPLEKLQKIARIREQVEDIKDQIRSFETSSKVEDMKQKLVISETIMNLLLQLDTIQGLQQSVRDVRRSVARELICLQEKLDSLSRQATAEHESAKIEENPSSKASDDQSIRPESSAGVVEPSSEHVLEQPSDKNCTRDFTSSKKMQEVEAEEKRDIVIVIENQELESGTGEAAELFNKEMVSIANGEHKEAPLHGEERTVSDGVSSVESKLLCKNPSLKPDNSSVSFISSAEEVFGAPSAAKVEAPKLDVEENLETQEPNYQEFEIVNPEIHGYGAQPNTQVDLEVKKGLVLSSEECTLDEVADHEAFSNSLEFVETLPGKDECNSENGAPITQSKEADNKQEKLQMSSLAEESDSMEKIVGDTTIDTKSVEVPSTSHVTSVLEFAKTIPGVGEFSSEYKTPITQINEAENKEEPQMLPVEEEKYFAEKASEDAANATTNIEVTCATCVIPGLSEESNDVGSTVEKNLDVETMAEKNLEMQAAQDQITVQNKASVTQINEVDTKEELQMLPGDENYFAVKVSEAAAADDTNIKDTCATLIALGASEEVNDVGRKVEKQAAIVEIMPQDQIIVQGGSSESGTRYGTNLIAANVVIDDKDMPSAPEIHLEATMDKDTISSLKEIHHKETSPMLIKEAASNEISTPTPKEEGAAVAQPRSVSSTTLSMEKLVEENEKLREMLEKLLFAGKEQLGVISDLNGRVKDLEKKLVQKKKRMKVRRHKSANPCKVTC